MNFLIIGGLLAFALVAILAAVLLGMREQRAEKARTAEQQTPSTQPYASTALNGQMHLFAEELHSLRQQAWELEQHLQGLADMLDRMQHAQSRHSDAEEAAEDSR